MSQHHPTCLALCCLLFAAKGHILQVNSKFDEAELMRVAGIQQQHSLGKVGDIFGGF